MLITTTNLKVWLSAQPSDMRKSIDGLSFLVTEAMKLNPVSGELFIFYNKRFDKLKILHWDVNGFCLWYKRLEKHRFKLPNNLETPLGISIQELRWLLDGLDFSNIKGNPPLNYDAFF
jgi:transposase